MPCRQKSPIKPSKARDEFFRLSVVPLVLVFGIATFPGEWLDAHLPTTWLHRALVAGDVDFGARTPKSLWSNVLVLPGLDVIDHTKLDTPAKIAALPVTASFRGRALEGAVLIGAALQKADFTAANLQGARLSDADLQHTDFTDANLQGADLDGANLQGATVDRTLMRGADLNGSNLRGAHLRNTEMQGANLSGAQLQDTRLEDVQLQGANLSSAGLQRARITLTHLEGANLSNAAMQRVILEGAYLSGARLEGTEMQGLRIFKEEDFSGALFRNVYVWRADPPRQGQGTVVSRYFLYACPNRQLKCSEIHSPDDVRRIIEHTVYQDDIRPELLAEVDSGLDPTKPAE